MNDDHHSFVAGFFAQSKCIYIQYYLCVFTGIQWIRMKIMWVYIVFCGDFLHVTFIVELMITTKKTKHFPEVQGNPVVNWFYFQ